MKRPSSSLSASKVEPRANGPHVKLIRKIDGNFGFVRPGAFFVSYVTFKISDLLARGFLGLSGSFNDLGQFFLLLSVYLEIIRRKEVS